MMSKEPIYPQDPAARPVAAARIRSAKPYDPVSSLQAIKGNPGAIHFKLDWNESTVPPSPRVFAALQRFLTPESLINWYPDPGHAELHLRISEYVGCRTGQILVTNGSDDALALVCQTYLDRGDEVVAPYPTYAHFLQFAEHADARLRLIRKEDPFSVSLQDIEAAINGRTKIVYLANPNNPTGTLLPPAGIVSLANRHPRTLFLVDEAYYEFSGASCAALMRSAPNVAVTRSFSKCFGLAGLRIGYVVAGGEVIANLRRVHNPKSVNKMAQTAAAAALEDLEYYRRYVSEVKSAGALTERFCEAHGLACRLSHANFVLIGLEHPVLVARRLRDAGVHVRDRSTQIQGMIRLTLGTVAQMREVLSRLEHVLCGCGPRSPGMASHAQEPTRAANG